jgi:hypothetical protein
MLKIKKSNAPSNANSMLRAMPLVWFRVWQSNRKTNQKPELFKAPCGCSPGPDILSRPWPGGVLNWPLRFSHCRRRGVFSVDFKNYRVLCPKMEEGSTFFHFCLM